MTTPSGRTRQGLVGVYKYYFKVNNSICSYILHLTMAPSLIMDPGCPNLIVINTFAGQLPLVTTELNIDLPEHSDVTLPGHDWGLGKTIFGVFSVSGQYFEYRLLYPAFT